VGAASQPLPRCWSSHAKCPWLPSFKRAPIQAKGRVVLERSYRANWTFPRSPLRRALRYASLQRIRLRPSTTTRKWLHIRQYACTCQPVF
jgi:hypothetical protein